MREREGDPKRKRERKREIPKREGIQKEGGREGVGMTAREKERRGGRDDTEK